MKTRHNVVSARLTLLTVALALPGAARSETLAEAIAFAYQSNPTLQAQRDQLRATDETYTQARSGYGPQVEIDADATYNHDRLRDTVESGTVLPPSTARRNLGSASVVVTQPLYTGGRTALAVRGSEDRIRAGRETLRATEQSIVLQVVEAYADVLRDQQALVIRQHNIDALTTQLAETQARWHDGEVTRTDVAQAQAQLIAEQASYAVAQTQLRTSHHAYATVVGRNSGVLAEPASLPGLPGDPDQAFTIGERTSPEFREALFVEQGSRTDVELARAAERPTVSLRGSFGYSATLDPINGRNRDSAATAQAVVTMPLFTAGRASSQIRQALDVNSGDRLGIEAARRSMVEAVGNAWDQMITNRANIAREQAQIEAAALAFKGMRVEYRFGQRSTLDVLIAEETLRDAELAELSARHDAFVGEALVLRSIGRLDAADLIEGLPQYDAAAHLRNVENKGRLPWEALTRKLDSVCCPAPDSARSRLRFLLIIQDWHRRRHDPPTWPLTLCPSRRFQALSAACRWSRSRTSPVLEDRSVMRSLLIGVNGLTKPLLTQAIASGLAPAFAAVVTNASVTTLRSEWAYGGPTDWVTIATGVPPGAHGVLWSEEAWAGGIRPVTMASWAREPFWERLARAGISVASVAWPGGPPGARHTGLHVDERFARTFGQRREHWSLPRGCAHKSLRPLARVLRRHPQDLADGLCGSDFAALTRSDLEVAARAMSAAAMAEGIAHRHDIDCLAVHLEAALPDVDAAAAKSWLTMIDSLCASLVRFVRSDTQVFVVSPGTPDDGGILIELGPGKTGSAFSMKDIAPAIVSRLGAGWTSPPMLPPRAFGLVATPVGYDTAPVPSPRWRASRIARLATLVLSADPGKAAELASQAVALVSDDLDLLDLQASALVAARRLPELPQLTARMRALAPSDPRADIVDAAAYVVAGDHAAAIALLVGVQDTDDNSLRRRLAAVWQAVGRLDLDIDPKD